MSRISQRLGAVKSEHKRASVAFITAGDPSLDRTVEAALAFDDAGVDVLELGVPFSDPLADGPVIQRASDRALRAGTRLVDGLAAVRGLGARCDLPLLLFSYFNPLLRYGLDALSRDAVQAGGGRWPVTELPPEQAVPVTDLPPEEAEPWITCARATGLDTVFLASPTSPDARLRRVAEASRGFV